MILQDGRAQYVNDVFFNLFQGPVQEATLDKIDLETDKKESLLRRILCRCFKKSKSDYEYRSSFFDLPMLTYQKEPHV